MLFAGAESLKFDRWPNSTAIFLGSLVSFVLRVGIRGSDGRGGDVADPLN